MCIRDRLPYSNAIDLILNLLRGTAELNDVEAIKDSYQKDLQGKTFTLLQVFVDPKPVSYTHLLSLSRKS